MTRKNFDTTFSLFQLSEVLETHSSMGGEVVSIAIENDCEEGSSIGNNLS